MGKFFKIIRQKSVNDPSAIRQEDLGLAAVDRGVNPVSPALELPPLPPARPICPHCGWAAQVLVRVIQPQRLVRRSALVDTA